MPAAPPAIVAPLARELARFTGVRVALLFGSQARGTARRDSDVDVAVLGEGVDRLALAAALSLAVEREVDVIDLAQATIPMLEELLLDAVVIHEGVPGAAALWRSRTLVDLETDRPWYARMQDAWLKRVAERGV